MRSLLALLLLAGCAAPDTDVLQLRGSDSEVNLVQVLGEAWQRDSGVAVAVTGGGSGTGLAALIAGTTDLANARRPVRPQEKLLALRAGVDPAATLFATDALSVVVHEDNPVASLTLDQLARVFRGEVADWSTFGGAGPVVGYGRQSNSGTYGFFRQAVLQADFGDSGR